MLRPPQPSTAVHAYVVKNIAELVCTAKENDELCLRIVERTEVLKPILEDLQLQATSAQLPSNIETATYHCTAKKT